MTPKPSASSLSFSVLIVAIGVGWLLTAKDVGHGIHWVWCISLAALGLIVFVVSGGFDKLSVVVGPLLLLAATLSILRQSGRMSANTEAPILVIAFGAALLVAQLPAVPYPKWYIPPPPKT